ncbi:MAG TPA: HPr family phosphocarrier protein [Verrucomicrobiota bacterium]|nr:HPr family phosphocarrier protein [Verrucomicrobiota bacterium]
MSAHEAVHQQMNSSKDLFITNKLGIHARPASMFVRLANQFKCEVAVEKDGEIVNGKSIMGLMMLAAGPGSRIRVRAKGADAPQAMEALAGLVNSKFNEE